MEEDFDSNIGFLVHDVARLMRTMYDRRMAPLGLTRSQWLALSRLARFPGVSLPSVGGQIFEILYKTDHT